MTTILIIEDAPETERTLLALVRQALEASAAAGAVPLAGAAFAGGDLVTARVGHADCQDPAVGDFPPGSLGPVAARDQSPASGRDTSPPQRARSVFRLEGEYWTIGHDGTVLRLKDSKGLRYIAYLLRYPGQTLRAVDVVAAVHSGGAPEGARVWQALDPACGPLVDRQALSQYRVRLHDVRQELEEADHNNDLGRIATLQAEAEWLDQHLKEACGLGGRPRALPSISERARQTLTKCVRNALGRIARGNAQLAAQLARQIKTGYACCYDPDQEKSIEWEL